MKKLIYSLLLCPAIYLGQIVEMVTGGTPISINERPYQVALFQNGIFRCGGSILNENWILTAAHCFDYPSNPNIVKVGITTLNQNNQTFEIKQKVIHPNYSIYNNDNDIALIKIKGDVLYGTNVQPINLVSVNENLYDINTTATVSGWGWLHPNSELSSNHLQKVDVPIISNVEASNQLDISYPIHPILTQNMIATGAVGNNRKGACHGDSGGALTTINGNGIIKQIGVVSWGVPKCTGNENSPSIYTKVVNYIDWIKQYVPLHIKIEGSSVICDNTTQTYTIDNTDNSPIQWQLSNDIEEISRTANSITIKPKSGFNGLATLTASNENGETAKKIWVGKPKIKTAMNGSTTSPHQKLVSDIEGVSLEEQGVSLADIKWTRNDTGEINYGAIFTVFPEPTPKNFTAKIEASNICGTETITKKVHVPKIPNTCDDEYMLVKSQHNTYAVTMKPKNNDCHDFIPSLDSKISDTYLIEVVNALGVVVQTSNSDTIEVSGLPTGTYYVRATKNNQIILNQAIIKH